MGRKGGGGEVEGAKREREGGEEGREEEEISWLHSQTQSTVASMWPGHTCTSTTKHDVDAYS